MTKMLKLIEKKGTPEATIFKLSNNTRYSILSSKNEQVLSPVSCKAFLEEVIWSHKADKDVPRTDFNRKTLMFDLKKARMSLTFANIEDANMFESNFHTLNEREKAHGIKLSKYYKVDKPYTYIIYGDKQWVNYVWKIGFWAFLLKCLSYPSMDKLKYPEKDYWRDGVEDNINKLLSKVPVDFDEKLSSSHRDCHSDGSISGINSGRNKNTKFLLG